MKNHQYNKKLNPLACNLRHTMTKAEACLWKYALRAGMMCGYSFRRQRPIGSYIADFVCLELRLIIEVDGVTHLHEETQVKDLVKEAYLKQEGFTILRFTDEEVLKNMEAVKLNIERCIGLLNENVFLAEECSKSPPPAPSKGG